MVVPIVMLVLGAFAVLAGSRIARVNRRVGGWPTAPGHVVGREVVPTEQATGTGPAARWEAAVRYEYEVEGKKYVGDRLYPSHHLLSKEKAEKFLDQVPDRVSVRFDPEVPDQCYLYTDSAVWAGVAIVSGLCMIVGSVVALM